MTESVTLQPIANSMDNDEESEHNDRRDYCISTDLELRVSAQARTILERNRELCESRMSPFGIFQRCF